MAQQRIEKFADRVRIIRQSLHQVVVGQDEVIDELLICALTGSHALLMGVAGPGQDTSGQSPGLGLSLGSFPASSLPPISCRPM